MAIRNFQDYVPILYNLHSLIYVDYALVTFSYEYSQTYK